MPAEKNQGSSLVNLQVDLQANSFSANDSGEKTVATLTASLLPKTGAPMKGDKSEISHSATEG
jgi:hypothetical protein